MSRHDPTAVTINELQAAGIEPTEVKQTGGGHHKVYFDLNGKRRFIVCATTPKRLASRTEQSQCRKTYHQPNERRNEMTKVRWLSDADTSNPDKWKDIENDLERQSNYYRSRCLYPKSR